MPRIFAPSLNLFYFFSEMSYVILIFFEHGSASITKFKRLNIPAMNYHHIFPIFLLGTAMHVISIPHFPASPLCAWKWSFWLHFQWYIITDILWTVFSCAFLICIFLTLTHTKYRMLQSACLAVVVGRSWEVYFMFWSSVFIHAFQKRNTWC